ncbi:MAG: hypothetical protein ACT443_16315 [Gemmatimonadota bacterium]
MKKFRSLAALFALTLAACDHVPERVFFQSPSEAELEGVWAGTGEITTDDDLASNSTYSEYGRGFAFPVVFSFDGRGRFSLFTGNLPTSYRDETDRTCSGVYTHRSGTLRLLPNEQCRALPLTQYTLGRILPDGISLEARTGSSLSSLASYASVRVRFRLERD